MSGGICKSGFDGSIEASIVSWNASAGIFGKCPITILAGSLIPLWSPYKQGLQGHVPANLGLIGHKSPTDNRFREKLSIIIFPTFYGSCFYTISLSYLRFCSFIAGWTSRQVSGKRIEHSRGSLASNPLMGKGRSSVGLATWLANSTEVIYFRENRHSIVRKG